MAVILPGARRVLDPQQVAARYRACGSVKAVAQSYGVGAEKVRMALQAAGVTVQVEPRVTYRCLRR